MPSLVVFLLWGNSQLSALERLEPLESLEEVVLERLDDRGSCLI
jgi:hypothetical protein